MARGELSEELKLRVVNAAGMKMLGMIAEDHTIAELAKEFPEEVTKVFMVGCQAGAEALYIVVKDKL